MKIRLLAAACVLATPSLVLADIVHLDDVIIDGSACVGVDCVNGESFGFDTIRLKENNLRIKFQDTSASASFPSNDWQLTANDSSNGGANKFSIDDIDGGRTPFTIEASAPSHSLYVDDGGRLGLGTSTPVADVHVKSGNTPTVRLEQDGTSGFTPQTWDMAGNEANFFIRDATNGSTLPFRVFPGAPSNALAIEGTTGDIGMGTTSPGFPLHVVETSAATRTMMSLENNGTTKLSLNNTSTGDDWSFSNVGSAVRISLQSSGIVEFDLDSAGNLDITGMLSEGSDRNSKTNIREVNAEDILNKVANLPISRWQYKKAVGEDHIGPMAQDFYAAFGLGSTDTRIGTLDSSGVALLSIQALHGKLQEKDAVIADLAAQVAELQGELAGLNEASSRLAQLEQVVADLLVKQADQAPVYTALK